MKTYRLENWDILACPDMEGRAHVGGQIYGHPDYPDGKWVMTDHVVYFDNDAKQVVTFTSGTYQLGEMSQKMKDKEASLPTAVGFKDAAGQPFTSVLHDNLVPYDPDDWSVKGDHKGVQDAKQQLQDILTQVFGKPGKDVPRH